MTDDRKDETSTEERVSRIITAHETPTVGPRMLHLIIHFPRRYLLFIALNIFDLLITVNVMNRMGMNEVNPLARWVLLNLGVWGFVFYKLFLTSLVVLLTELIHRRRPRTAAVLISFGCLAMTAVVTWGAVHLVAGLTY